MALKDDLLDQVKAIFRGRWDKRDGRVVPESADLGLSNEAIELDAAVLYADMSESTALVDNYSATFAAEVYKAYLYCSAKIIRSEGGEITAYDGDRIMAVFIHNAKCTAAVRAALRINYARLKIINPAIKDQYPKRDFTLRHAVGIDTSPLLVARTGIRGSNDLVWVGRAANHAAKLCALPCEYSTRISKAVYGTVNDSGKYSNGTNMWESTSGDLNIYGSKYYWQL